MSVVRAMLTWARIGCNGNNQHLSGMGGCINMDGSTESVQWFARHDG